jgi:hypothetical protein
MGHRGRSVGKHTGRLARESATPFALSEQRCIVSFARPKRIAALSLSGCRRYLNTLSGASTADGSFTLRRERWIQTF